MKNYTQTTTKESTKQVDNELKKMLMADLRAFKIKSRFTDTPVVQMNFTPAA
jgi:hypothetical protein